MRRALTLVGRGGLLLLRHRFPGATGIEAWSTTRRGGWSAGEQAGLNVDPRGGDEATAVAANQSLLLSVLDVAGILLPRQVHGDRVLEAADGTAAGFDFGGEADAMVSRSGAAVGVLTADCLPVVLAHAAGGMAAVHAGWRGIAARILPAAAGAMLERWGGGGADLAAWLGPCIGPCCCRVGEEVADDVARASGDFRAVVVDREGPRLDLWRAAEAQLLSAGLAAGSIAASPLCTSCNPGLFFSHRRDRGNTGRMVTVAVRR